MIKPQGNIAFIFAHLAGIDIPLFDPGAAPWPLDVNLPAPSIHVDDLQGIPDVSQGVQLRAFQHERARPDRFAVRQGGQQVEVHDDLKLVPSPISI